MSTVAVVTTQHADEEWVVRALAGALVIVDSAPLAELLVVRDDCLAAIAEQVPATTPIVVLGDPANPPERAVHVVTRTWPDEQLRALLSGLAAGPAPEPPLPAPSNPGEARDAQRAIGAGRKLAITTDLVGCEILTVEILVELIEADRAYALFYDGSDGSLWSEAKLGSAAGDDRRAVTGLAGFAARTGRIAHAKSAGSDPRFAGVIDDPDGDSADHVIAQPVFGSDGQVHAVLVCARRARRPDFGAAETMLLARFARLVTPVLDQLSIHVHAQAIIDDAAGDAAGLFRREAADAQAMPRWGDVVRVTPRWMAWAYWLLVVLLVASGVFVVVGTVSTYSKGPAIVRSTARTLITARTAGNVVAVEVAPGDRATRDTVIARLDDTDQRAAVERLEREFENQLRNHMLDPGEGAAAALRAVRNNLETARASLDERLIRATAEGIIGDLRVRPGQRVQPGDIVALMFDNTQGLEIVALLPGEDRPQLAPGMALRIELTGYRYAYQSVVIDRVSSDVIGPAEARRVLGAEVADGLELDGPVVLVHGRLPTTEFSIDGRTFRYHDGMLGTAEVRVREEPIVFALIPGTRRFR